MGFQKSFVRTAGSAGSKLSRKRMRSRMMLLDQLEARVLMSGSNNGYVYSTLASFGVSTASANPTGNIVQDSNGDTFGTSYTGGTDNDGTVWEIPAGSSTLQTLVSFNGSNGSEPIAGLTIDGQGNLYGTTRTGGNNGVGTVFEVPVSNLQTIAVLGSYAAGSGAIEGPSSGLVVDGQGDVFGTTSTGGAHATGSVWEIPVGSSNLNNVGGSGSPTTIASFAALSSGKNATGAHPDYFQTMLLIDGTLYGDTDAGGASGDGDIFSVSASGGAITDLADFTTSGSPFFGSLVVDGSGDLFGTAGSGGTDDNGYLFELPQGSSTIVNIGSFGNDGGEEPNGQLVMDANGDLFGLTDFGAPQGRAFEAVNDGGGNFTIQTIATFPTEGDAEAGLIVDGNGDLIGTTFGGGQDNIGAVFQLTPVHLVITGVPSLFSAAPDSIDPVVTLEGPTGQTITDNSYSSNVTLTIDNGGAVINNVAESSQGVVGFGQFQVTTPGAGYTLTATDANGDIAAVSNEFTVAPQPDGSSTKLVFTTEPVNNTGELPIVTVSIENSSGQVVTTDDSIVQLSTTEKPGNGALDGTLMVQAVNGVAQFTDLTETAAGQYRLAAEDQSLFGSSNVINVAAVPTLVSILSGPSSPLTAGVFSNENVEVGVFDQFGNFIESANNPVQLQAVAGTGKTVKFGTVNAHDGIASFKNIKIKEDSEFELGATGKGLESNFKDIDVIPAAASRLAFVLGPPDTTAAAPFSVSVEVLDKFGNLERFDTSSVITLSLKNPTSGILMGTTTATVSEGVAHFGPISISVPGTYQLVATDSVLGKGKTISSKSFKVGAVGTVA